MHSNKPKNSEVDAYTYIKEELEKQSIEGKFRDSVVKIVAKDFLLMMVFGK